MPNKKSAKKELRKSKKRYIYNKNIKDTIKYLVKKARKAIETKNAEEAKDWAFKAFKAIDKAAQKGVIKKNTRDRKKSRLHKKLNTLLAQK